ncbi:DUF1461 domain-containing protein [Arhodomonas sp. SL1]|uniref:DUF1461 domain-containing protein n=1 Tax=Arhodomonas sp. SL1 TaxID=3425691 RepID=UPI003F880E71
MASALSPPQRAATAIAGVALPPALLLAALGTAWGLLSLMDFAYPLLYHWLDIGAHINEYGPQNRYREGFHTLSATEHQALFAEIVAAINRGGDGLALLDYRPARADAPVPLLRTPEIEHLRLVAEWVGVLRRAALAGAVIAAAAIAWLARVRQAPSPRTLLASVGLIATLALAFTAAAFDADGWFARFHDWAFPPGHQWFFYYQESLMTTLMKAPDLFGPLAAMLGGLTAALAGSTLWLVHRLLARRRAAWDH